MGPAPCQTATSDGPPMSYADMYGRDGKVLLAAMRRPQMERLESMADAAGLRARAERWRPDLMTALGRVYDDPEAVADPLRFSKNVLEPRRKRCRNSNGLIRR